MPPRIRSTRQHLVVLVLGAMIPFALLAALFIHAIQMDERREAHRRLTDSALLLAQTMDREFDAAAQVLETLVRSESLRTGDLAGFHRLAVQMRPDRFASIALADADMNILLNTRRPFGEALPRPTGEALYRRALEENRQVVGDLIMGSISRKPLFAVARPVWIGGERRGVLLITMTPARVQTLLERLPDRYLGMIMDSSGTIVARSLNPETMVGQKARPEVLDLISSGPTGFMRLPMVEGVDTFLATHRSPLSGWVALVGERTDDFHRVLLKIILGVTLLALLLLSAGLAAALFTSRRLFLSMEDLGRAAASLGQGERPALGQPAATLEIATVAEALARSHDLIVAWTDELQQARAQAEEANDVRSRFLAYMSHELRTPLTAVIGFSEALLVGIAGKLSDPRQEAYARNIETAGRHLLSLIDDILDLAKIDAGHMEFTVQRMDPASVIATAVTMVQGVAGRRSVHVVTSLPDPVPEVTADRRAVLQILVNLLSNAIKFSHQDGTVEIRVSRAGGLVAIAVQDRGLGMTPEEVKLALTPFRQGANAHLADTRGTGLGLPLAMRLAESIGGRIDLISAPERGTLVTLFLPEAAPREESRPEPAVEKATDQPS